MDIEIILQNIVILISLITIVHCKEAARFIYHKKSRDTGREIKSLTVQDVFSCGFLCEAERTCASFAIDLITTSGLFSCKLFELNRFGKLIDIHIVNNGYPRYYHRFLKERVPYYCDFEGWQCNWLAEENQAFTWRRHQGDTQSDDTGPSKAQSGTYYMYTEATGVTEGDIAVLETVKIEPSLSERRCLTYSYHMFGSSIGKLRVYSIGLLGGTHLLNSHQGNHGADWLQAKVSFQSWEAVTLKFEAERGSNYFSDTAIDNVKITDRNCV